MPLKKTSTVLLLSFFLLLVIKVQSQVQEKSVNAPTLGDSLIFSENFSKYQVGADATSFKTNGAASVATIEDQEGKWMDLKNSTVYKLAKQIRYPKHFTITFDLFAKADQVGDMSPLSFGFTTDNSVRDYNSNAGTYVELQYYDTDEVNVGSNNPKKYVNTSFDLSAGLNQPLHVTLIVDETRMAVYLNEIKLADTILFSPTAAKNFYICAPFSYKNEASLFMSNLKIYGFKK